MKINASWLSLNAQSIYICVYRIKLLTLVNFGWFAIMLDIKIKDAVKGATLKWTWGLMRSQFALLIEHGARPLPVQILAYVSPTWKTWRASEIQQRLPLASLCEPTHQRISV